MAKKADLLDTLAQSDTEPENLSFELSTVTGYGDKQTLKKRARAKSFAQAISVGLVEASEKSDGAKIKPYWRSYHCASVASVHEDGKVTSKYCKNRWCMVCNRIRTAKLIKQYLPNLKEWLNEDQVYMVTLTRPNIPAEELKEELKHFISTFTKIARMAKQQFIRGKREKFTAIRKIECSYNPNRNDFNPHLHILIKGEQNALFALSEWLRRNPTADRKAQDIQSVSDGNSLLEVFKYSAKMIVKVGDKRKVYMDALHQIYTAFDGVRTLQPYGFKCSNPGAKVEAEERTRAAVLKEYEWDKYQSDWMTTELDIDMDTGEVLGVNRDCLSGYKPSEEFKQFLDTAFVIESGDEVHQVDRMKHLTNPDKWQNYRMKPIEDPEPELHKLHTKKGTELDTL